MWVGLAWCSSLWGHQGAWTLGSGRWRCARVGGDSHWRPHARLRPWGGEVVAGGGVPGCWAQMPELGAQQEVTLSSSAGAAQLSPAGRGKCCWSWQSWRLPEGSRQLPGLLLASFLPCFHLQPLGSARALQGTFGLLIQLAQPCLPKQGAPGLDWSWDRLSWSWDGLDRNWDRLGRGRAGMELGWTGSRSSRAWPGGSCCAQSLP